MRTYPSELYNYRFNENLEHPDYYRDDNIKEEWLLKIYGVRIYNKYFWQAADDYDALCESLTWRDPEDYPDFDYFIADWFEDLAYAMTVEEFVGNGYTRRDLNDNCWDDFIRSFAKQLREDDLSTAAGYFEYFRQWYKKGLYRYERFED